MNSHEVQEPILNKPFEEPQEYWFIKEGEPPEKRHGRRPAIVFPPRDQKDEWTTGDGILARSKDYENAYELVLANRIRQKVKEWRADGYPGVTRTTKEILDWWTRDGRDDTKRLFFAQREAAETIIFLKEARADYLQGINVPREELSEERVKAGYAGFARYALKMATGSGKTTVMGMLAAWSILNKVNDRSNATYSDVILVCCPNVTIRDRLKELDPELGEASIYRTRDLVPPHLMPLLTQGKILITNWHVFEPQTMQSGGVSARVIKAGVPVTVREWVYIGQKSTTARGKRYLSQKDYEKQVAAGILSVKGEEHDDDGTLHRAQVESVKYIESDTALINRVLGREIGGKQNILVMNDEAHHAYRIRRDDGNGDDDEEESEEFYKEATVWIEAIHPDTSQGEAAEIPRYETSRGPGSTGEVSFWTSRDVREVLHSHLNYVVADTKKWEQSAAYFIDRHSDVSSFVKNAGLGFAIPYLHNGQMHDYMPDFIVKYNGDGHRFLILETKGYDPLEEVKRAAAERWVSAVNAEGSYGKWAYRIARKPTDVDSVIVHSHQSGTERL